MAIFGPGSAHHMRIRMPGERQYPVHHSGPSPIPSPASPITSLSSARRAESGEGGQRGSISREVPPYGDVRVRNHAEMKNQ